MLYPRTAICLAVSLIGLTAPSALAAMGKADAATSLLQTVQAQQPAPPPTAPAPAPAAPAPATPPAATPTTPGAPAATADAFGEEVALPERIIIYMNGNATWDSAFETLIDSFKQLNTFLERQGLKAAGPSMTIYTSTDDTGFSFQAAVPLAAEPPNPPQGDIAIGKSPGGRALKFVHRGSYDSMDTTYEAITNHLDEKRLEAKDLFIEEYATDPVTTPEDQLVITVLVPIK
jgi:effector-binding domain-containing protein